MPEITQSSNEPILSIKETYGRLKISKATLYSKVIPHLETVKMNGRTMVVTASIQKYIDSLPRTTAMAGKTPGKKCGAKIATTNNMGVAHG